MHYHKLERRHSCYKGIEFTELCSILEWNVECVSDELVKLADDNSKKCV